MKNLVLLLAVFFALGCVNKPVPEPTPEPVVIAPTPVPGPTPTPLPTPLPTPTPNLKCATIEIIDMKGVSRQGCAVAPEAPLKYAVVDVSSVTCGACIQNFPIYAKFVLKLAAYATTRTVLVDKNRKDILDYVALHPSWFQEELGLDVKHDQMRALGTRFTPTTYVLDATGVVVYETVGVLSQRQMDKILELVQK